MEEKKESDLVKSVADFIDKITEIGKIHKSVFFRGHSDESFELVPSIYRKNDKNEDFLFIENEDKIYREVIAKSPTEFNGKKTIEALALMQHYGVPTRVLDLTTNALIALYFACSEKSGIKGKNGEVLLFDIPKEYICFSDSDRVTILSNLAKCDSRFYYYKTLYGREIHILEKKLTELNYKGELIKLEYSLGDFLSRKINSMRNKIVNNDFDEDIDKDIDKYSEWYPSDLPVKKKNDYKKLFLSDLIRDLRIMDSPLPEINERYFGKLLHNIKEDKSYFQPIIEPNDVGSVFAVIPKMDNPRIIRQSGAFLLFGIKEKDENNPIKPMADVPKEWIVRGNKDKGKRILIDKSSKNPILKELDMLGINKSSIFPEIESIAESVKNKYKK